MKHRRDIDGLRALAVLPVLFYHAGISIFSGGYVGVDIFFVISGFLITGLIMEELKNGTFSVASFYERRIRRIFPALFFMIFLVMLAGVFFLLPREFSYYGSSAVATAVFASNIFFWKTTSNYFDGPAETHPLLHTWSLAVEEQFYIIFPILLFILYKFSRKYLKQVLLLLLVGSLILSIWGVHNAPTATFYLAPTRAWELLIGSVLAAGFVPDIKRSSVAGLAGMAGLICIAYAVFFYDSETAFPGLTALPPCLGAALVIYAGSGSHKTPIAALLSSRLLVGVGLISYSLYLWHWPLIVFLRHHILLRSLSSVEIFGVLLASFIMAIFSWRYIEKPFRGREGFLTRSKIFSAGFASIASVIALGLFLSMNGGLASRFTGLDKVAMQNEPAREDWAAYKREDCFISDHASWKPSSCKLAAGQANGGRALLWGDSYAAHYAAGFLQEQASTPFFLLQYTSPRCPPLFDYVAASNPECTDFNKALLGLLKENKIDTVIMSAKWQSYLVRSKMTYRQIGMTANTLSAHGIRVVLVGQSPLYEFSYPDEFYFSQVRHQNADAGYAELAFSESVNSQIKKSSPNAYFFDPTMPFCREEKCIYRENGMYLVSDSGHMTRYGSEKAVKALLNSLKAATENSTIVKP
ncbi:MAG: acyltransferase family protein [Arenimonas sp.]